MEDGERRIFVAEVAKDSPVALPFNMPRLLPTKEHYDPLLDKDFIRDFMWPYNDGVHVLEYSMSNYSRTEPGSIMMDPLEGPYIAEYKVRLPLTLEGTSRAQPAALAVSADQIFCLTCCTV